MSTGTPTTLDEYTSHIVRYGMVSQEIWSNAVEEIRRYTVEELFPTITLKTLSDQPWLIWRGPQVAKDVAYIPLSCRIVGGASVNDPDLFSQQGFFELLPSVRPSYLRKLWGLTRKGLWVSGKLTASSRRRLDPQMCIEKVEITAVSLDEMLRANEIDIVAVTAALSRFIEESLEEKKRRLNEISNKFAPLHTLASVIGIKFPQ